MIPIVYRGVPQRGRIQLTASGSGSKIDYCQFLGLAIFNNPAIDISSQDATIKRSTFDDCELGMLIRNGANPLIDSCTIKNSHDDGIDVENGLPTIQNSIFDGNNIAAILLEDTALVNEQ